MRALTPDSRAVAREWTAEVAAAAFLPDGRAHARAALEGLLRQLLTALHAQPFDPDVGYRAGQQLVSLRMSAPSVIRATTSLLIRRLPALVDDQQSRSRIPYLVGQIAAGFSSAQRDSAVSAAEDMNRSQKLHWRRMQADYQQRLRHQQLHDPQSQLPNRAHLRTHLAAQIATGEDGERMGVCLLNIDRYAQLSDALSHDDIGHLLAAVGDRLRLVAGESGYFLAHLGDDLFALVVAASSSVDDVVKAADDAQRALEVPILIATHHLRITTTAGLVEGPATGTDPDTWVRDSRCAVGWAYQDRRERACFDGARAAADRRRHQLAAAMPAALDDGQFVPYFQPIYELQSHRIIGVEALVRWQRPGQLLGPQDFITLAEQTGLIRRLGGSVLEQACRQGVAWRHLGHDLLISVNVSPYQLAEPGLPAAIAALLQETGLPAHNLQLEITESAEVQQHHDALDDLAERGIRIAIDDFGTGYSNLAALTWLPVTCLKLDGEFIRQAGSADAGATALLRRTIELCRDLHLKVIAEGIETTAEEQLLKDLGYTYGQGYRLAKPAPAADITHLLGSRNGRRAGSAVPPQRRTAKAPKPPC